MIRIKSLVWDEWNIEHIKKHRVSEKEVEEVCQGVYRQQPTYGGRYLIFGKTAEGRLLTLVLAREQRGKYYVVTARNMSSKERRRFFK